VVGGGWDLAGLGFEWEAASWLLILSKITSHHCLFRSPSFFFFFPCSFVTRGLEQQKSHMFVFILINDLIQMMRRFDGIFFPVIIGKLLEKKKK